jgi:amino acid adenylation domain-containing protein
MDMNDSLNHGFSLPPEQQAIRDKCFHPSGTFVEFPIEEVETSIPARFEKIVRMYPERVALKTKDRSLTYDSLNKLANRMANELLARCGFGQRPVALLLSKNVHQYTAILGVLKAGKMYEVLEPSYPAARIRFILNDLQTTLLVTDSAHFSLAQSIAQEGEQIFNIETLDLQLPAENLDLSISPDAMAWIHFTSASTGQPKGVIQNHRNVLNRVRRETNNYHICSDDRFIFPASRGGDMFTALLNGASVCPLDIRKEGLDRLEQCVNDDEVTVYASVTSMFRYFVNHLKQSAIFPTLRVIKLIGEPLYKRDVELFRKHISPFCVIVNRLGSNETGTICEYNIDASTLIPEQVVPVGYPIQDLEIRLLDDNGKAVGENEIGEFSVRSQYLSPGYWNNPALTEASFTPDPDGSEHVTYRIGDLGRRLADGCFMHLGRKDFQVKILGNRVEIPEVEGALLSLGNIKETAVVDHDDGQGNKRLVAYFVPVDEKVSKGNELQLALARLLPNHMIPTTFIAMDKLPLTGMGKVDRRSLPSPDIDRFKLKTPFVEPRTLREAILAKIWAEVLALDKVGIHDNFFELGGHSLAASRVISRVIQTFQLELPIKALFDAPTVAEMAAIITGNQSKRASEEALNRMLSEVEAMTEEETQKQLAGESARRSKRDGHE